MFKFIRKKILEGMIKDLIADLPVYKKGAIEYFEKYKDEILEDVKNAIFAAVKRHFEPKAENQDSKK